MSKSVTDHLGEYLARLHIQQQAESAAKLADRISDKHLQRSFQKALNMNGKKCEELQPRAYGALARERFGRTPHGSSRKPRQAM